MKRRHKEPIQPKLRLRDRRRRMMWVEVFAGAAVGVIALVLVFYVARLPELTITAVEVRGASMADEAEVQTIIEEALQGSYAFLIPRTNAFFAPRSDIEKKVLSAFPVINTVTLSHHELETLVVTLGERVPVALWCEDSTEVLNGSCYLMDEKGFTYVASGEEHGLIRYSGVLQEEPVGAVYLDGGFPALRTFVEETERILKRSVASVSVDALGDAAMTFAEGGELRFVRTTDSRATLDNIASVVASERFKEHEAFEYADFRYGNKVYVKFIGE